MNNVLAATLEIMNSMFAENNRPNGPNAGNSAAFPWDSSEKRKCSTGKAMADTESEQRGHVGQSKTAALYETSPSTSRSPLRRLNEHGFYLDPVPGKGMVLHHDASLPEAFRAHMAGWVRERFATLIVDMGGCAGMELPLAVEVVCRSILDAPNPGFAAFGFSPENTESIVRQGEEAESPGTSDSGFSPYVSGGVWLRYAPPSTPLDTLRCWGLLPRLEQGKLVLDGWEALDEPTRAGIGRWLDHAGHRQRVVDLLNKTQGGRGA